MWILPSSISSRFALERECLTKACASHSSEPESEPALWHTANGKPRRLPSSYRGWKKKPWSQLLFGQAVSKTCDAKAFEEWWTEELRASRASHSARLERSLEPMTPAGSGLPTGTPSAARAAGFSGLKMSVGLFELDWNPSSMTLPKQGGLRNGAIFERPAWEPRTSASGFSSWPSPDTNTSTYSNGHNGFQNIREAALSWTATEPSPPTPGAAAGVSRLEASALPDLMWPPPAASDNANRTTRNAPSHGVTRGKLLAGAAASHRNWPPPVSSNADKSGASDRDSKGNPKLTMASELMMRNWPPPGANDHKGSSKEGQRRGQLDEAAEQKWPTPDASTAKYRLRGDSQQSKSLEAASRLSSHQVPEPQNGETSSPPARTSRQRLNPAFVCWLMGWPTWWTRLEPTSYGPEEMESWRSKLRSHLAFCLND